MCRKNIIKCLALCIILCSLFTSTVFGALTINKDITKLKDNADSYSAPKSNETENTNESNNTNESTSSQKKSGGFSLGGGFSNSSSTTSTTKTDTTSSQKKNDSCSHTYIKTPAPKYLAQKATCNSAAKYYSHCSKCGKKGTQTFTYGSKLSHSYTKQNTDKKYLKSVAKCTTSETYYYSCEFCGKKYTGKTFKVGEPLGHDFTIASKYVNKGEKGHQVTLKCSRCSAKRTVTQQHEFTVKNSKAICACGYSVTIREDEKIKLGGFDAIIQYPTGDSNIVIVYWGGDGEKNEFNPKNKNDIFVNGIVSPEEMDAIVISVNYLNPVNANDMTVHDNIYKAVLKQVKGLNISNPIIVNLGYSNGGNDAGAATAYYNNDKSNVASYLITVDGMGNVTSKLLNSGKIKVEQTYVISSTDKDKTEKHNKENNDNVMSRGDDAKSQLGEGHYIKQGDKPGEVSHNDVLIVSIEDIKQIINEIRNQ